MSSLLWYICLSGISFAAAAFAIYNKRHLYKTSTLVVFYLFSSCLSWIGEFIVLGVFNSYAYKPNLFSDPWAENLTGHLLLNCTMFPAAAILMVTYSLKYIGIIFIIAFFIFAEYFFVKLGIYNQHWWKYYMSVINTVAFLVITKKWFHKMTHMKSRLTRATVFYFVAFIIIHFPIPLLLLYGKQYYSLSFVDNLVGNLYRSSIIFIFTYHLIECFLIVYLVCILDNRIWKLAAFAVSIAGQSVLAKVNILVFQNGWNLLYLNLVYIITLSIFILIERHTLKQSSNKL